ncbi:hypothetical protein XELAEV_18018563mg [Xenopus laevis]|uniref:Major facilitator superfamily (MFS) profile domain-containing protein n=1 Tax=Xenopus laevis TaxID=8355 RepID=A0A974DD71_XENLA|nr:hypothetical protein XELAEV_18018563mg [Xenopus laevis]
MSSFFHLIAVLPIIIKDFHAVDITAEFITLAFLCTKVILSPSLSYATSRYNQKMVMCIGLFFYSSFSFGCTFIPKQGFWLFLLARLFVASMAECCFSAAPIVFVDIFYPDQRTRVLGFYTCIKTVCCILACLFGIPVIDLASSHWRYALWTTPGLGLFGLALAIIIMKNPQRGGMDEEENENEEDKLQCSCFSGLKELLTNCSFLTSTAGALCYACVYGAKNSWVSGLIEQAQKVLPIQSHCLTTGCNYDNLIYGIIRCAADLMGLIIGMELSKRYKKGNPAVDAVLCGIGLIVCAPFFMLFIFFPEINMPIAHVFIAISGVCQAICQVPMLNMKLNLVRPKLRGKANVIHQYLSKLLASVGHIYFIPLVSAEMLNNSPDATNLRNMEFALAFFAVVAVIGGKFFFITAHCIKKKQNMEQKTIVVVFSS